MSVIIPYFKAPAPLETCLGALLAQTHTNLEIICIGEGVDDPAHIVADQYAAAHPNQLTAVRQHTGPDGKARGGAAGRNLGLTLCSGEYIMFMDAIAP